MEDSTSDHINEIIPIDRDSNNDEYFPIFMVSNDSDSDRDEYFSVSSGPDIDSMGRIRSSSTSPDIDDISNMGGRNSNPTSESDYGYYYISHSVSSPYFPYSLDETNPDVDDISSMGGRSSRKSSHSTSDYGYYSIVNHSFPSPESFYLLDESPNDSTEPPNVKKLFGKSAKERVYSKTGLSASTLIRRMKPAKFVCSFKDCDASFTRNAGLKSHYKSHLGATDLECPFCGTRTFTSLDRHKRRCKQNPDLEVIFTPRKPRKRRVDAGSSKSKPQPTLHEILVPGGTPVFSI